LTYRDVIERSRTGDSTSPPENPPLQFVGNAKREEDMKFYREEIMRLHIESIPHLTSEPGTIAPFAKKISLFLLKFAHACSAAANSGRFRAAAAPCLK
jgi:hypothetical protein